MSTVWRDAHNDYKEQDWINIPSIFAEQVFPYFPNDAQVLELGAGQAQDGCYFAEQGCSVVTTDFEESALELARQKIASKGLDIEVQEVDLREELPFSSGSFDVVYAHLSLHYFDHETTRRLIQEAERVLKPGGMFAFLVNSVSDPEYQQGEEIEPDYFQVGNAAKRYFSVDTARMYTQYFDVNLLDDLGETYKDKEKGVHNLIRFVGTKRAAQQEHKLALPFVSAIVERDNNGTKEVLLSTRWQPNSDALYTGTLEFPAGVLDLPYESVYAAVAREIKEEVGLTLKSIRGDDRTKVYSTNGHDESIGFRPFCCLQQLKDGKPWVGFVFIAEVEDGELVAQLSENKEPKWLPVEQVKQLVKNSPEKIFGLELPAWEYYFKD